MKRVYIVYNYWELLISLILAYQNQEKENIFFLNSTKISKSIILNLQNKYQVEKFKFSSSRIIKFFSYYFKLYIYLPIRLKKYDKKIEITAFSDQEIISRYFIKNKNYINLYEHGIINYQSDFKDVVQKIKKIIFHMEKPYGRNKYVKNIFLKFPEKSPKDIKDKVKKLDIDKFIDNLTPTSKENILQIFDFNIKFPEKEIALLLTQPLEIKTCSEKEKKEIYQRIYEKYSKKYIVYIKPHPLEKTDYNFLTTNILNKDFPIELFLFEKLIPSKVITLFSSGCFSFINKCDVDFLGTKVYKKIYEKRKIEPCFYKSGKK